MNRICRKKRGFTIIEVLFAIVILSFALSAIFVLLNSMFKVVNKVKELSFNIDKTPIVYSVSSPLIHHKNIENYKSDIFNIPRYCKINIFNEENCKSFITTFIAEFCENENIFKKQYFSNIIFIPLKKNDKEKNES